MTTKITTIEQFFAVNSYNDLVVEGIDFTSVELEFDSKTIKHIRFEKCRFGVVIFTSGTLQQNSLFTDCSFVKLMFKGSFIYNADFLRCHIRTMSFESAHLKNVEFKKCYIERLLFNRLNIEAVHFEKCFIDIWNFDFSKYNNLFFSDTVIHRSVIREIEGIILTIKNCLLRHLSMINSKNSIAFITGTSFSLGVMESCTFDNSSSFNHSVFTNVRFERCIFAPDTSFYNTIGDGEEFSTLKTPKYTATWHNGSDRLQIGCKNFTHDEWKEFKVMDFAHMDTGLRAYKFYDKFGKILESLVKATGKK